jgi:hypothetical protein
MKTILIDLSVDEINAILQVFGDLPTKTGIYPLLVKIKDQAEAQLKAEPILEG